MFVACEVDWQITTTDTNCVQIQLTSNSPVAFSQIAALYVDNSRCGSDVQFFFPDSAFILQVPAYCVGLFPVITNSLGLYAFAEAAAVGDVTLFQILNSNTFPVAVQPSAEQTSTAAQGISLASNSKTALLTPPQNGTLTGFQIMATTAPAGAAENAEVTLTDGNGKVIWAGWISFNANAGMSVPIAVTGLHTRFYNGLFVNVVGSGVSGATASVNVFYTEP